MGLETEVQKAIEKNLSAEVGKVLKERLDKAEKDAAKVAALTSNIDYLNKQITKLTGDVNKHTILNTRESAISSREEAALQQEQKLEVEILKIKLEESEKRADVISSYTSGLVRNTLFRKEIFDSETANAGLPIMDGQGNAHYPLPTQKSHTSTESEE